MNVEEAWDLGEDKISFEKLGKPGQSYIYIFASFCLLLFDINFSICIVNYI